VQRLVTQFNKIHVYKDYINNLIILTIHILCHFVE